MAGILGYARSMAKDFRDESFRRGPDPSRHELVPIIIVLVAIALFYLVLA
jgi:hypothetical protein